MRGLLQGTGIAMTAGVSAAVGGWWVREGVVGPRRAAVQRMPGRLDRTRLWGARGLRALRSQYAPVTGSRSPRLQPLPEEALAGVRGSAS